MDGLGPRRLIEYPSLQWLAVSNLYKEIKKNIILFYRGACWHRGVCRCPLNQRSAKQGGI
jgi:hypothetical protein